MDMATKNPQQAGSTVKQEREARRLEKVEAFKRQQAKARRNRLLAIVISIVSAVVIAAVVVVAIVTSNQPKPIPTPGAIGVLQTFLPKIADSGHVETKVDYFAEYGMNPPAGGVHSGTWLNCGVYTEPVPNENAVHDLEHGAIWITYDADALSAGDVATLQEIGLAAENQGYITVSPYVGLPAPVVVSAWGFQLALDDVNDPKLAKFITKYLLASTAPEPGASCTGALEAPGRIG